MSRERHEIQKGKCRSRFIERRGIFIVFTYEPHDLKCRLNKYFNAIASQ